MPLSQDQLSPSDLSRRTRGPRTSCPPGHVYSPRTACPGRQLVLGQAPRQNYEKGGAMKDIPHANLAKFLPKARPTIKTRLARV